MKYKILVQEEKLYEDFDRNDTRLDKTYMDTVLEVSSSDEQVVAATLRSFADKLNPSKPVTRGGI